MRARQRKYPPPPPNAQEFTRLDAGEALAARWPRFMFYTLAWFSPVLKTARRQGALYNCDIYALEKGMTAEESISQYASAESLLTRRSRDGKMLPNIIRLALQMNLRDFLLCIFATFIYKLASLCFPISVNYLVAILSQSNVAAVRAELLLEGSAAGVTVPAVLRVLFRQAFVWIVVVVLGRLMYTFFFSVTYLTARKILFKTQLALQDRLFTKLLTVSELTKSSILSGTIINFLFTDIQNSLIVLIWLPILVELIIAVVYSAIYLSLFTHPSAMAGLVGFAVAMPLSFYVISRQGRITSLYLMNSDARIRVVSEILKGIKVIKFFGHEDVHMARLSHARNKELNYLQRLLLNEAFVYICGEVCLPLMMLFAFTALASCGKLTNSAGYSSSLIFSLLADGISFIPPAFNSVIVSVVSGRRINSFLELPDVCENRASSTVDEPSSDVAAKESIVEREPEKSSIALRAKGTFTWGFARHLQKPEILDISYAENKASIKRLSRAASKLQKEYEQLLAKLGLAYHSDAKDDTQANDKEALVPITVQSNLLAKFTHEHITDMIRTPSHTTATADRFALQLHITPPSRVDIPADIGAGDLLLPSDEPPVDRVRRLYVYLAKIYKFIDPVTLAKYTSQKMADGPEVLRDIDFSVRKGDLVGVFGAVGTGKTALHLALLGELTATDTVSHGGSVAYYSQAPCIISGTILSNILFFKPLDDEKLANVIRLCCLQRDLELLPNGLKTEIGERGITLSGGQKARIALARAVYSGADIYLLDDPLSAVDAHVARYIWDNCIVDYLIKQQNKTVLISSHQTQFFADCSIVYEITSKQIVERNKQELLDSNIISASSELSVTASNRSLRSLNEALVQKEQKDGGEPNSGKDKESGSLKTITVETHSGKGAFTMDLYGQWIKHGGIGRFSLCMGMCVAVQMIQQFMNVFIDYWSSDYYGIDGYLYPLIYAIALALMVAIIVAIRYASIKFSIVATTGAHRSMADAIFHTRMSFFETNPMGRILNRMSSDVRECDREIYDTMMPLCEFMIAVGVSILTSSIFAWPSIFAFLPFGVIFMLLLRQYRAITPQVKRLSSMITSPMVTLVEEVASNLPTIRAGKVQADVQVTHRRNLARKYAAEWMMYCCNRWASFNYSCISVLLVLALSISVVIIAAFGDSARYVGVVLLNGFGSIDMLNSVLIYSVLFERSFASFERVHEYSKLAPEEDPNKPTEQTVPRLPSNADRFVQIRNMSFRHRKELPLVLDNVTLTFRRGERIGVVGRTGAGKSSLVAALFRLAEPERAASEAEAGNVDQDAPVITIDGYPIERLSLQKARSLLTIIPQDPFLFEGTLRTSLCPYSHMVAEKIPVSSIPPSVQRYTDAELWSALEKVCLRDVFESQVEGLEAPIAACGENLSAGQRQLVCVARALLRDAQVVILDEATAQVDRENDAIIQTTIRTALVDRVIIAIAHRINTIIDFDRVIVVDAGKVREFDTPRALLNNPDSLFSKLVAECDDAEKLIQIAMGGRAE